MKHADFEIGRHFFCGGSEWKCTDRGTRTILAVKLEELERAVLKTPPFDIAETVFDENDFGGCKKP